MSRNHNIIFKSFQLQALLVLLVFSFSKSWGQTTIFSENMGNPAGTTAISSNVFQNSSPISFSGSGDVRNTTVSSGYTGASGGGNVFLTNNASKTFQICGINTSTCNTISLSFGVWKSSGSTSTGELQIQYSSDGGSTFGSPSGITVSGGSAWSLQTISSGIPSAANLCIKFTNTSTGTTQFRIDDVVLTGSCTACSAPTTTITPTTQTVCAGSTATIGVTSSAATPNYTWQASANGTSAWAAVTNGTPVGATYTSSAGTLTITAGSTYYYRCLVTDGTSTCVATSSTSTLVVNTPPSITTQPTNTTVCSGNNAGFSVAASGSPLTYQWQQNTGSGYSNISGATSAALSLTGVTSAMNSYSYQCVVSVAGCSSATSNAAVLTVNTTPAAPPVPTVPSNSACTTGTFSAMTSTVTGVTWYWETSASGVSTATSTATNYTTSASSFTVYARALDASGTCWSTTSSSAAVTVNTAPSVTLAVVSKTVCSGTTVTFTTGATGTSPTYLWQENTGASYVTITNTGIYGGATSKTLTLTGVTTSMSSYSYQCVISVSGCSSTTTTPYVLTVIQTPAGPPAPSVPTNPACTTGTFSAMSSTVVGVTWYWETSSTGVSTTSSTATIYARALESTGTCWSASSNASVAVNSPASITTQPTDKEVCMVGNTSFAVVGTGTAPKQWQYSSDGGVTFTNVPVDAVHSNVTSATMNLTGPTTALNGYVYQCVISVAGCPVVTTNTVLLSVYATPAAPPTPTALANPACSGTSLAAMTSTAAGITWYWQGTNSAGTSTTNPTSLLYNITSSGTYYVRARVDGSSCLSTSSSTAITINTPPAIAVQPTDKTQCTGSNTTFAVSATGTSLTYVWQYNTGSGFVNVPNAAPYSNVTSATMSITNITAGMNGYQYQCIVSGASPCAAATSSFATLIITAAGTPSLAASSPNVGSIACNAFNLSWTNGSGSNRLVIVSTSPVAGSPVDGTSYTASNTYGSGGTIASGEYVVYKGTGNSVFISGLTASTTYYYKIFEFNGCSLNYLTSGVIPNGNATTSSCSSTPGATAVYIDACPGSCGYEGNNELIWGSTGSYALYANLTGPTLHYGSITTPTFTQISSYGTNASAITALNASIGSCTNTVFVDANTVGYIPANANFLIANTCLCNPTPYDFSGLCNSGPIYVVFGTGPSWDCNTTGGIFGNSGSGLKYFDLDFTSMGVSLDPIYNFNSSNLVTGNGAAITLNPNGGAATSYFNSGCTIPLAVLPIDLIDFYGTQSGSVNYLNWKVASEKNVIQYIIQKSEDGVNFTELTRVRANRLEASYQSYACEDNAPYSGITYYKLSTLESNGKINHYKIIDVDRNNKEWKTLLYQNNDDLVVEFKNSIPKNAQVNVFDLSGKLLIEASIKDLDTKLNVSHLSTGIYFVKVFSPYKTENFKIIINNN